MRSRLSAPPLGARAKRPSTKPRVLIAPPGVSSTARGQKDIMFIKLAGYLMVFKHARSWTISPARAEQHRGGGGWEGARRSLASLGRNQNQLTTDCTDGTDKKCTSYPRRSKILTTDYADLPDRKNRPMQSPRILSVQIRAHPWFNQSCLRLEDALGHPWSDRGACFPRDPCGRISTASVNK